MLEITAQDIGNLADDDLRSLVGLLCEAELRSRGLPTSAVTWGGDQDAPDEGIDVRVALPANTPIQGFVPRPATGIQVKKPDMPRCKILAEMRPSGTIRPAIQELADQSGAYIIVCSSASTSDPALRNRRAAMTEAVQEVRNADSLALDFYDRSRLATWVRGHPGLIPWVRERIGTSIQGWRSYGAWANPQEGLDGQYLIDEGARIHTGKKEDGGGLSVLEGIKRICELLRNPGNSVRLVGLSGVGKTRLGQALFDERIDGECLNPSLALYTNMADDPNPQPVGLASDLLASRTGAILVVDNCPPDLHQRLTDLCRSKESTISIVTVEYDIREDEPEGTEVFELRPSSIELVEKLIKNRFQEVSAVDAHTIAEFSGGNARVAIALASTIGRGDIIAGLRDEELFKRLFQQRHEQDESLLIAAQACSLVYSFQGEDVTSHDAELPRLGALIGKSAEELFRHVAELHRRDLVQKRSIWRAVLPHAIANRLAAMALQNVPWPVLEEQLVNCAPARLLGSFSRRLGYLHDSQEAVRIIEQWLGIGGLLGEIAQFNDLGKAMLNNIAPAAPTATLAALERALNGILADQVVSDHKHYVQLLRSLAYDPNLFDRSAELLIKLADVEEDSDQYPYAGDAFRSLFYVYLSGTHASIEQRLRIIEQLLKSGDTKRQGLGLRALDATLEARHFTSSYSFEFGGRSRDFGYWPGTDADVWHWYSTVLRLVENMACSDLPVASEVCAMLANSFRGLWTKAGMYDDLDRISRAISAKRCWRDGWTAVRETIKFDLMRLPAEAGSRLTSLERSLRPRDLLQKVRYLVFSKTVGRLDLSDFDEEDISEDADTNRQRSEVIAEALGKKSAEDSRAFDELLPELVSTSGQLFPFGRGLAKGAHDPKATWSALVAQLDVTPEDKRDVQVLRGFLNALRERDAGLSDTLLDDAVESAVLASCFPLLQTAVPIDETAVIRLKRSLASDSSPIWMFRNLAYGRSLDGVSGAALKELVLLIAEKSGGYEPAVEILSMRLYADNQDEREPGPELIGAGQELMRRLVIGQVHEECDYNLGEIAKQCLKGQVGARIARDICRRLVRTISKHEAYALNYPHLVLGLVKAQPAATFDALFTGRDAERQQGIEIIEDISEHHTNPLGAVPEDELLEWCDRDPAIRYPTIAAMIQFFHRPDKKGPLQWTALAGRTLERAPDNVAVLREFVKRFVPMSWSGSRAAVIEERAQLLGQLDGYSDPRIVEFVATEQIRLSKVIEHERELETEHDRAADERFE